MPAECRTNYIQKTVTLALALACVKAGVLSPPGPCMHIFSKVCCCVRGSLVQICYISFADIMGSGTEWYHCRPPTDFPTACVHQAPTSQCRADCWMRDKRPVNGIGSGINQCCWNQQKSAEETRSERRYKQPPISLATAKVCECVWRGSTRLYSAINVWEKTTLKSHSVGERMEGCFKQKYTFSWSLTAIRRWSASGSVLTRCH